MKIKEFSDFRFLCDTTLRVLVALILVTSCLAFGLVAQGHSAQTTRVLQPMLLLASVIGAGVALVAVFRGSSLERRYRFAWGFLALALLARVAGDGTWLSAPLRDNLADPEAQHVWRELAFGAQSLLLCAALFWMVRAASWSERIGLLLDSVVTGGSLAILTWWLFIEPESVSHGAQFEAHTGWSRPISACAFTIALVMSWLVAVSSFPASNVPSPHPKAARDDTDAAHDHAPEQTAFLLGAVCIVIATAILAWIDIRALLVLAESSTLLSESPIALITPALFALAITLQSWAMRRVGGQNDKWVSARFDRLSRKNHDHPQAEASDLSPEVEPSLPSGSKVQPNFSTLSSETSEASHVAQLSAPSLRWIGGSIAFASLAVTSIIGAYHVTTTVHYPRQPEGEFWWPALLVCIAALRYLLFLFRSTHVLEHVQRQIRFLHGENEKRARQLSALHSVALDLNNTLNREQILSTALNSTVDAIHADAGAVWLRTDFDLLAHPDDTRGWKPGIVAGTTGGIKNAAFIRRQTQQNEARRQSAKNILEADDVPYSDEENDVPTLPVG
ncbi:MAG TPA: hypothetical protein VF719_10345, partial [Abditibacteriaceae bacterium]